MTTVTINLNVLHLNREFEVEMPVNTTVHAFYEAVMEEMPDLKSSNPTDVFELVSSKRKIYPDMKDKTLEELNIQSGDTIYLKKDVNPGACRLIS